MTRALAILTLLLTITACAAENPDELAAEGADAVSSTGSAASPQVAAPVDPSMVAGNDTAAAGASPAATADAPALIDPQVMESVLVDVGTAAPRLESFYRGDPYPQTVDEVVATLDDAGVVLSDGNAITGYAYDAVAVEFELCVEHTSGAWATYDTAPMSLREQGGSGGCPDRLVR